MGRSCHLMMTGCVSLLPTLTLTQGKRLPPRPVCVCVWLQTCHTVFPCVSCLHGPRTNLCVCMWCVCVHFAFDSSVALRNQTDKLCSLKEEVCSDVRFNSLLVLVFGKCFLHRSAAVWKVNTLRLFVCFSVCRLLLSLLK